MFDPQFKHILDEALAHRHSANQWRSRIPIQPIDATHVRINSRTYINFCSNNYLGLTHHPSVIRAIADATIEHGAGSAASGLISGYSINHARAEVALARWKGTEASLLLPSGYQANHAIIQTLAVVGGSQPGGVRFLLDKLSHASLIDAVRGSQMPWRIFPHNGYTKLQRLLQDSNPDQLQVVATESIFSMDGDAADLPALARLKQSHPFFLLLDEAHASGIYGTAGRGYSSEVGLENLADASIVTLSKALGSVGGAICASKHLCDAAVNFARAYIYSTSIPPGIAAGIEAAVSVAENEPHRRLRVRQLARHVRSELALKNNPDDSPIIPVILGHESAALHAAEQLRQSGLLVVAVRPPTVPPGSSRLRITVSSEHTDDEIQKLLVEVKRAIHPSQAH